jgi:hypothetical protein
MTRVRRRTVGRHRRDNCVARYRGQSGQSAGGRRGAAIRTRPTTTGCSVTTVFVTPLWHGLICVLHSRVCHGRSRYTRDARGLRHGREWRQEENCQEQGNHASGHALKSNTRGARQSRDWPRRRVAQFTWPTVSVRGGTITIGAIFSARRPGSIDFLSPTTTIAICAVSRYLRAACTAWAVVTR